jgi:hypothetical protein
VLPLERLRSVPALLRQGCSAALSASAQASPAERRYPGAELLQASVTSHFEQMLKQVLGANIARGPTPGHASRGIAMAYSKMVTNCLTAPELRHHGAKIPALPRAPRHHGRGRCGTPEFEAGAYRTLTALLTFLAIQLK